MRRAVAVVALLTAATIALSGCAEARAPVVTPTAAPYSADAASRLQAEVLSVSSFAAGGDLASALARLDELTAALADARARGQVTTARFDSISISVALVRTDLEAAIAANNDHKSDKPGKGDHG